MKAGLLATLLVSAIACSAGDDAAKAPGLREGTVDVDGAQLRWVREGEGPQLLVIGSAVYYPKAFSPTLREHFELIFVDGRHFAPAYRPPEDELGHVTLDTFIDDLEAVRTELGIDRWAVLGHSVHAQIALGYAHRYAARTTHLIMVGGVPFSFSEFADETARFWEEYASPERREALARGIEALDSLLALAQETRSFAVSYRARGALYWADPNYDAAEVLAGLENGPAFGRLTGTIPSRATVVDRLSTLTVPSLVILGRLDFAIPHTVWEELLEPHPGISYVLLQEDSHNPQTENPKRFDTELLNWFENHR